MNSKNSEGENIQKEEDEFEVSLQEQLENANIQIKDLQDYVKKKGLDDLKMIQQRQESFSKNEKLQQEKYNMLLKTKEENEVEKQNIIDNLNKIIKQNEEYNKNKKLYKKNSLQKQKIQNLVNDIQVFANNIDEQDCQFTQKMKEKIKKIASNEEVSIENYNLIAQDQGAITNELIRDIIANSLDIILENKLISQMQNQKESCAEQQLQQQQQSGCQKTKKTDLGITLNEFKSIQYQARSERKACHLLIVQIEKQMYELKSQVIENGKDELTQTFFDILDNYLFLPHRIKPIFDACKKMENIILKGFKN